MRAMDAVRFGAGIRHEGYNLFVLGPAGIGKRSMVRQLLEPTSGGRASARPTGATSTTSPSRTSPWRSGCRRARAPSCSHDMAQLVDYLRTAIPALFESEEYRAKAEAIQEEFSKRQEQAFKELGDDADKQDIVLLRTPGRLRLRADPQPRGDSPRRVRQAARRGKDSGSTAPSPNCRSGWRRSCGQMPQWRKERSEQVKQLNQETTLSAVAHVMDELRAQLRRPARGPDIPRPWCSRT